MSWQTIRRAQAIDVRLLSNPPQDLVFGTRGVGSLVISRRGTSSVTGTLENIFVRNTTSVLVGGALGLLVGAGATYLLMRRKR